MKWLVLLVMMGLQGCGGSFGPGDIESIQNHQSVLQPKPVGKIVFCRADTFYSRAEKIWLFDVSSGNAKVFVEDKIFYNNLRFSHSGAYLLYGTDNQIKIVSDKGALIKETNNGGFASWAPDDSNFIYAVYYDGLYRCPLSGNPQKFFSSLIEMYDHHPVYSPAGDKIAWIHHSYGTHYTIDMVDPDGSGFSILCSGVSDQNEDLNLQWLPDGRRLVYKVKSRGIYLLDVVTKSAKLVLESNNMRSMSLSPDGRYCVYFIEKGLASPDILYLVDTTTWQPRKILDANETVADIAWYPALSSTDFAVLSSSGVYVFRINGGSFQHQRILDHGGAIGKIDWAIER